MKRIYADSNPPGSAVAVKTELPEFSEAGFVLRPISTKDYAYFFGLEM